MFSKKRYRRRNKPSQQQSFVEGTQEKVHSPFVPAIQSKLNVGRAGDAYELEADRTADKVVEQNTQSESIQKMEADEEEVQAKRIDPNSLTPFVQKAEDEEPVQSKEEEEAQVQLKEKEEESGVQLKEDEESSVQMQGEEEQIQKQEDEDIQTKRKGTANPKADVGTAIRSERGRGHAIEPKTKVLLEKSFGSDFSHVEIHTDSKSQLLNRRLHSRAFTNGSDIFFNKGEYRPKSLKGLHLLAHELTHTIQQGGSRKLIQRSVNVNQPSIRNDIDLFDPSTSPKPNSVILGHTQTKIGGRLIKELEGDPETLKDLIFPIPQHKSGYTSCYDISPDISVDISHDVNLLKGLDSKKVSKSQLSVILGGLIAKQTDCEDIAQDHINIVLCGLPSNEEFLLRVEFSEMEHVQIDDALVDKYVRSYEEEVELLPDSFSKVIGSCKNHLNAMLKRDDFYNSFMSSFRSFHRRIDEAGGSHSPEFEVTASPDCKEVTVCLKGLGGEFHFPDRGKWKPK